MTARIAEAAFVPHPPFARAYPRQARARRGLRFERAVHEALATACGPAYLSSPWLQFRPARARRPRFCSPDGVYIDLLAGLAIVFEVKLSHTPRAADQLALYSSVVGCALGGLFSVRRVEVVRYYDCAVPFPAHAVVASPFAEPADPGAVGVWIYHPGEPAPRPARCAVESVGSRVPAQQESPREPGDASAGSAVVRGDVNLTSCFAAAMGTTTTTCFGRGRRGHYSSRSADRPCRKEAVA